MVLRANTGGKSLDRGSVFGAISRGRGSESTPEPEIGSLRAGGAQIGGEIHGTEEAMECSTQPRQKNPRALQVSLREKAGPPDPGQAGRGEGNEERSVWLTAACLFVERACKCRFLWSGRCMHYLLEADALSRLPQLC